MKILLQLLLVLSLISCTKEKTLTEADKLSILEELKAIDKLDQQFAGLPPQELFDAHGQKKAWELFEIQKDSVSQINRQKIKELYNSYGYLGEQKIGEDAATSFWLPIQHADNDVAFQVEMHKAMAKEIEKGSKDQYIYAMLEDRIHVNQGKPQRFGSQLEYDNVGKAIPINGFVDASKVDSLRAAYNMPSFKEYYNMMTLRNFEMNKQYYAEKGIHEAQLYE